MATPNPLLPVLQVLDRTRAWPDSLDAPGVRQLIAESASLNGRAHDLATLAEHDAVPLGGVPEPENRALSLFARWVSGAARDAWRVLRTARIHPLNGPGAALLEACTAALTAHTAHLNTAHLATGQHGTPAAGRAPHDKGLLNRALGSADWVGAYQRDTPVTAAVAMQVFTDQLPPGWYWEHRPHPHPRPSADIDPDPAADQFSVARHRAVLRDRRRVETTERITVTADNGPDRPEEPQITHESFGHQRPLSWAEVCQVMARCYGTTSARTTARTTAGTLT